MHLRVLGSVELVDQNGAPDPLPPRLRRLLAGLLVHADAMVSMDSLADIVWPSEPPDHPQASLHNLLARLRGRLTGAGAEVRLLSRPPGYSLLASRDDLDASLFQDLVDEARQVSSQGEDPARLDHAVRLLDRALDLWRGPAYAEFTDDDFARPEGARLTELWLAATENRIDAALDQGRPDEALDRLEKLIAAEPLRERPQLQLMLARYRTGQQAAALDGYQRYRRLLDEELGVEPSAELACLQAAILRHDPGLATPAVSPHPTTRTAPAAARPFEGHDVERESSPRRTDDPTPVLPQLVGREADIALLDRLVRPGAVVTLVGPGGVGKTSLASVAAARLRSRFADGVRVCELATLDDVDSVADAIGTALSVPGRPGGSTIDRLVEFLRPARLLLVFDNCEHVLGACTPLAAALSRACPGVAVLTTSREPLGLPDELVTPVAPLSVEAGVALFVERARNVSAGFDPDESGMDSVAELCNRLDRLPLAIELAAARMRVMSPDDLVQRLSWRFRLLHGGARTARHQTLRALVDWSYDLLEPSQRVVFDLLSVFATGFSLTAAEQVVTAVPGLEPALDRTGVAEAVLALAERSMTVADPSSGPTRFVLLETLRSYARERLVAGPYADAARRAHASYVSGSVTEAAAGLFGPRHGPSVERLDALMDEIRAAHAWALANDLDLAALLVTGLSLYVETRMPAEVPRWAEQTLEAVRAAGPGETAPRAAGLCAVAGAGARFAGDLPRARQLIEQGLDDATTAEDATYLRFLLAEVCLFEGQLEEAGRLGEELAAAATSGAYGPYDAFAQVAQGVVPLVRGYCGDVAGGLRTADELRIRAEDAGDELGAAWMRYIQGELVLDTDPERAGIVLTQALEVGRRLGDRYLTGVALVSAASVLSRHGEPTEAAALFGDVVEHWRQAGDWTHQWTTIRNVTDLLTRMHRDDAAAVLLGALDVRPAGVFGDEAGRLATIRSVLVERLGADRFAMLTERGAGLDDNQVVDRARSALADDQ